MKVKKVWLYYKEGQDFYQQYRQWYYVFLDLRDL